MHYSEPFESCDEHAVKCPDKTHSAGQGTCPRIMTLDLTLKLVHVLSREELKELGDIVTKSRNLIFVLTVCVLQAFHIAISVCL